MAAFMQRSAAKSAVCRLDRTIPDIGTFESIVQRIIMTNPFGCTPHMDRRKNHPPVERVREIYTAKFVYENTAGKRVGTGTESYDSVAGYRAGIATVISNMANIAAHRGTARHIPASDMYSATLACHDPSGEIFFISLARDRVTLSSYSDDAIRNRVSAWTDSVTGLV